jgi:limonene-1,2-epoxide hydrolase
MASDSERLVTDFCKAWERRNLEELMGYFTEDAVYHNVPMEPAKGKQAIRDAINTFLPQSSSIQFEVLRAASSGNLVMNERIDRFDMGGKKVALPVAGVFETRGGKICLWRDYFDLAQFTKQLA